MLSKIKDSTLAIAVAFVSILFLSQASLAQPYVCLPTCDTNDAKFLVLSGTEIFSLNNDTISFGIRSPGENASVELGVFDGEQGDAWEAPGVGANIEVTLLRTQIMMARELFKWVSG